MTTMRIGTKIEELHAHTTLSLDAHREQYDTPLPFTVMAELSVPAAQKSSLSSGQAPHCAPRWTPRWGAHKKAAPTSIVLLLDPRESYEVVDISTFREVQGLYSCWVRSTGLVDDGTHDSALEAVFC